ncbi:MAG TPA: SRPBCC family protein, partial [Kofleriaceae bacterium]|nr:SRPBCC family protein [Kofleriaceae bacterium]
RLVYEAFTRPEHLRRWWGPRDLELVVCEIDLRVGGSYRFVQRAPDGQEFAFRGVYRELRPPERIVSTFVFELVPDHEAVTTVVLEEQDGVTTLTSTVLHDSVEARDAHYATMEAGADDSYDRLAELLASLGGTP